MFLSLLGHHALMGRPVLERDPIFCPVLELALNNNLSSRTGCPVLELGLILESQSDIIWQRWLVTIIAFIGIVVTLGEPML